MKFHVNGKEYTAKDVSYNFVCDLEEMGVDVDNLGNVSLTRHYFAYCAGLTPRDAGNEIECHLINNGDFPQELTEALSKKMDESAFFRALAKRIQEQESVERVPEEAPVVPQESPEGETAKEQ